MTSLPKLPSLGTEVAGGVVTVMADFRLVCRL